MNRPLIYQGNPGICDINKYLLVYFALLCFWLKYFKLS